jgi:regulator of protease activity HflC (stomatin/prohibitin superfamily)
MLLMGAYKGTVKDAGFWWMNPFNKGVKISQRVRNLNSEKLKVNDVRGNPIEIGAVVVWRVTDTYKALFEVDDYASFVNIQSESALRHLASEFPYDTVHDGEKSLRGSMDEVNAALLTELQARLGKAGIVIDEARLSHLAYAPEIAGAMLRRQQAEATVAARFKIVEGAVGMVEGALEHLERNKTIELDPERKAAMVSNLLVVLCSEQSVAPVVNAGTLYP